MLIRRVTLMLFTVAVAFSSQNPSVAPRNDLPNPYQTFRDWAVPPGGGPWAAVTAVEVAPDESIYVIHRCSGNSCAG